MFDARSCGVGISKYSLLLPPAADIMGSGASLTPWIEPGIVITAIVAPGSRAPLPGGVVVATFLLFFIVETKASEPKPARPS